MASVTRIGNCCANQDAEPAGARVETSQIERIGRALPDYEVDAQLGKGAMGVVYGGRHRKLDRAVAIKELPEAFSADPNVRERFGDEARTLASLSHPHVVPIFDYVERDGQCLLVMEALPGGTVWERFVRHGLTMTEACAAVLATCAGLEHAHGKGVLHRDVKPENLMFSADNDIKVTDFGIAKVVNGDTQLATATGMVLGTPAYMAPEQGEGLEVDARADVYAVGTMLYELLSGRLPFDETDNPLDLLSKRSTTEPISLRDSAPKVPTPVAEVTMRAIARHPQDRPATAEALGCELGEAAAAAWGPGWIDATDVSVSGSTAIAMAARTTSNVAAAAPPAERTAGRRSADATVAPDSDAQTSDRSSATIGPDDTIAPEDTITPDDGDRSNATIAPTGTTAPPDESDRARETSTPEDVEPAPVTEQVNVKPQRAERAPAPDYSDIRPSELINVAEVVNKPSVPVWRLFAGLLALAAGILVALVGLGEPTVDTGDIAGITVNGEALDAEDLEIDLAESVTVAGVDGAAVELRFSAGGLPLGATESTAVEDGVADVEPGLARWLAGGAVTATLVVFDAQDTVTAEHEVLATATQPWYLTATGIGSIVVLLFGAATVESNLAPLRKGRRRPTALIGLIVAGAALAVGLCALAAAVLGVHLTIPAVVASVVLSAAGCVLLGMFLQARGRSRRVVRVAKARGLEVRS